MTRVTLLTDFGTVDGYAAAMAGVIAAVAPGAVVEHASHEIPPGDIPGASLALSRYARFYPEGTIHVVVVDPGVGTRRRALAASIDDRFYVAPDNGVLSRVLTGASTVRIIGIDLHRDGDISSTFHGRDVFAPAAARLAAGRPLDALGRPVHDPVILGEAEPVRADRRVEGVVIQVDRFGSLITNIPASWLPDHGSVRARVGSTDVGPLRRTYADVAPGELVALVGSLGLVEISVRNGDAAARLGAGRGAIVTCEEINAR